MYAGHRIWRAITCCLAAVVLVPSVHSELGTVLPLRVCADPNNLPFSNDRREGFENRIAELLAHDMGTTVQFNWRPQMRGFVRKGLKAGACDVYMGVPAGFGPLLTTKPYYRSTYVIVYRTRSRVHVRSLDDSALHSLKVGVHMIGDDYQNTPPAQALAARGIVDNVRGYPIVGDLSKPNPQAEILRLFREAFSHAAHHRPGDTRARSVRADLRVRHRDGCGPRRHCTRAHPRLAARAGAFCHSQDLIRLRGAARLRAADERQMSATTRPCVRTWVHVVRSRPARTHMQCESASPRSTHDRRTRCPREVRMRIPRAP
jgi:hypothetical protein